MKLMNVKYRNLYLKVHFCSMLDEYIHSSVGKKIVTKALGFMSDEAEDDYAVITDSYKEPEGSLEERITMMAAVREANKS